MLTFSPSLSLSPSIGFWSIELNIVWFANDSDNLNISFRPDQKLSDTYQIVMFFFLVSLNATRQHNMYVLCIGVKENIKQNTWLCPSHSFILFEFLREKNKNKTENKRRNPKAS